jgi:predicted O-methyltransferase YrrM
MRYILGIPFVNRPDLLRLALQSVEPLWSCALLIDNSDTGLDAAMWPVPVVRPPVPLTLSQTMNLLQRLAAERSCDVLLFMHNDAEAGPGTPERLLAIVEEATTSAQHWGVVFTHYDTLAAFSMEMTRVVGQWDTTLPQYFADGDYYLRVRRAGYEIINTGLHVTHHNNASSTLKSDPRRRFLNSVTFPLYERYYTAKWGGLPGNETYDWPFNGALSMVYVNHLREQELFQQLAGSYDTVEGNLLERADEHTTAAQIEALRYAINLARPQGILETGTGKSMFGYVLSHLTQGVTLYTFDGDPRCVTGVELLNTAQTNVRIVLTLGDTKQTLQALDIQDLDLAWIDGGHDETTALSDIRHTMRLGIPLIALDDTRTTPEVACAIDCALHAHPEYVRLANPFYAHDARGIAFLRRQ